MKDFETNEFKDINDELYNKLMANKSQKKNAKKGNRHNGKEVKRNKEQSSESSTEIFKNTEKNKKAEKGNPSLKDILGCYRNSESMQQDSDDIMSSLENQNAETSDRTEGYKYNVESHVSENNYNSVLHSADDPMDFSTTDRPNYRNNNRSTENPEVGLLTGTSYINTQFLFELVVDTNFFIDNLALLETLIKIQSKFLTINRRFFKICIFDIVLSELDKLKQGHKTQSDKAEDKDATSLKFKAIKANNFIYKQLTHTASTKEDIASEVVHLLTKKELSTYEKKHKKNRDSGSFWQSDDYIAAANNDDKILQLVLRLQTIFNMQGDEFFDYSFVSKSNMNINEKFKLLPPTFVSVLSNDKVFCLKLLSHSIKTISLPPSVSTSSSQILKQAKMIILKCLSVQIKSLLQNWQNMVTMNSFEVFIKDENCNKTMLFIFEEALKSKSQNPDFIYLNEVSSLFSVNNPEAENMADLLDSSPDMLFLFKALLKYSSTFQRVLQETLKALNINEFNIEYCNMLLETVFFHNSDMGIEDLIERVVNCVVNEVDNTVSGEKEYLLGEINTYVSKLNNAANIWRVFLNIFSSGVDKKNQLINFITKLDFVWNDILAILADLLKLTNVNVGDLYD